MRYLRLFYLLIILILGSCKSKDTYSKGYYASKDDTSQILTFKTKVNLNKTKSDTTGFLKNCKEMMLGSSVGALQSAKHSSDSTGFFCFLDSYENKSYEIILSLKGGVEKRKQLGYLKIGEIFDSSCENTFNNFDCFAFVLPMRDPDKQEDMHAMNIDFPVMVRTYKRIDNDNWQYIKTTKVKTFEDYAALQFKTIYSE